MSIVLNSPQREAIERFVQSCPSATANHRPAWIDILREGLGHRPMHLSAWRDGQCVGWLPMVETSSWLFGRHLVSLPYVNEAGVLGDEGEVITQLVERAAELGRERRVRFVELRNREPADHDGLDSVRTDKMRMVAELPGDDEAMWKQVNCKVRNQVRKGQKHDLTVSFGGAELLDGFYSVFSRNMRDLGSPAFPKRLFAAMLRHLGDDAELCVVLTDDQPIAGAVLTHHRGVTEVPSASCLRQFNHTNANMLMYWELIRRAIGRGARQFDFGRSSEGSGTYRFKRQWTAEPQPTGWQHVRGVGGAKPIVKEDGKFSLAIEVWKHLPMWLARIAGPPIVRGIP